MNKELLEMIEQRLAETDLDASERQRLLNAKQRLLQGTLRTEFEIVISPPDDTTDSKGS